MTRRKFIVYSVLLALLSLTLHKAFIPITPTDWDEYIYTKEAECTLEVGFPTQETNPCDPSAFFFYQPFLYFVLLGNWMRINGDTSIETARNLSAIISSLCILATIYAAYMISGSRRRALLAGLLVVFDGWTLYTSGLVKLDTGALTISLFGIGLFAKAYREDDLKGALWAGLVLGLAVDFKHLALFGLIAIALHWLFTLRKSKIHGFTLLVGLAVVAAYVVFMYAIAHKPYLDANIVQINRALGRQAARGLNPDIGMILNALAHTYFVYAGSLLLIVLAICICATDGIVRTIAALRHIEGRGSIPRVAMSYTIAAVLVLALLKLRNPHYIVALSVPSAIVVSIFLVNWLERSWPYRITAKLIIVTLVTLSLASMAVRNFSFSGADALKEAEYVVQHVLPADAVFVSEDPVCHMKLATQICVKADLYASLKDSIPPVEYVITITTFMQQPPQGSFARLLSSGNPEMVWGDWNKTLELLSIPDS